MKRLKKYLFGIGLTFSLALMSVNLYAACRASITCNIDILDCFGWNDCNGIPEVLVECDGEVTLCETPNPNIQ